MRLVARQLSRQKLPDLLGRNLPKTDPAQSGTPSVMSVKTVDGRLATSRSKTNRLAFWIACAVTGVSRDYECCRVLMQSVDVDIEIESFLVQIAS